MIGNVLVNCLFSMVECDVCVWDSSQLTSIPPHSETDPWWQLLGEYCDVSIRLSKKERERDSLGL